jgi:hypothetical protein
VCARVAWPALLRGPSTPPLDGAHMRVLIGVFGACVCAACATVPLAKVTGSSATGALLQDATFFVVKLDGVSPGGNCNDRRSITAQPWPQRDSEIWAVSRCGTVAHYSVTFIPVPPGEPMPKAGKGVRVQRLD